MNIQVSNNFKKMTAKAIVSIALFILSYILLLILGIGLTILSVIGGIAIIMAKPMLATLALGIGLASLGFFVVVFLFKFIFKKHKIDRSHLTEITKDEEPKLFKFIEDIVVAIDTNFPNKVYLSTDVNASVFYDSSFWSMFFPIKKNLQIGLGLVNTITEQEFKAILAHEFGHFSQRSMKVGSYVYNVNQVIFNMLYDNESFDKMIQKWASISGYFSIFVMISLKIIQGIQWILRKMYDYVNLNYMALSREMEFHADEVAANIAGYPPLKHSLLRMDLAYHSYNSVLNFYGDKISENIKSDNIYKEQSYVMNFLGKESSLNFKDNLPLVTELETSKYNKSKLNIKNQWASHPSVEERVLNIEKTNIIKENPSNFPAIALFNNPEELQINLTAKLFSNIEYNDKITSFKMDEFKSEYVKSFKKNTFNKIFNGYYDNKNPNYFDLATIEAANKLEPFETLFSKEKVDMVYDYIGLENDKNTLTSISNKDFSIKTFDYDGQKYKANDANELLPKLEKEIENLKTKITENDIKIYNYYYQISLNNGTNEELKLRYSNFFKFDKKFDQQIELYSNLLNSTHFFHIVTPIEQINSNLIELKKLEKELKKEISNILNQEIYSTEITERIKENFEKYLAEDWVYFSNQKYIEHELQILFTSINDYNYLLSRGYFLTKKDLLNLKNKLFENENHFA
ncbi:MAG: M48 family metalloprotease [bacterium]|nr:M48 family metalloprotease [bacterium]